MQDAGAEKTASESELRDGAGLALEAELELRILRELGRKNLDGHTAIESRVTPTPDLPHASRPRGATISYGPRRAPETIWFT